MKTTIAARNVRFAPHQGVCVTGSKISTNELNGGEWFLLSPFTTGHITSPSQCGVGWMWILRRKQYLPPFWKLYTLDADKARKK